MFTHAPAAFSLNVLVVDGELSIRKALAASLESAGHRVVAVSNSADALAESARRSFDLAFIDPRHGTDKRLDIIPRMHAASPWTKIVVITSSTSVDTAVLSMKSGSFDYLSKPFTPAQVKSVVDRAGEMRRLEQDVASLHDTLDRTHLEVDLHVTRSPLMHRALHLAQQVSMTDAPAVIRGESGTGKGLLAAAIHNWSARGAKPFATIACSALSAELLESDLFGHTSEAIVSAPRDNPGRITLCEGGTLYLNEIGAMPPALQPKLLHLIQTGEYERMGERITRRADIRVITGTNEDLEHAVAEGRFRADLLYRLNVIQIDMPPLRERREDILPIAERLLAFFTRNRPRRFLGFTPEAIDILEHHPWPGNIRELRNVIERCAILTTGDWLTPECLRVPIVGAASDPGPGSLITLAKLEELHIRRVLAGAKTLDEAAEILGIDAATLWRRRKKYKI